jgi:hypothetical protein
MPDDIEWFPERPGWTQAATLFGVFGGAFLLGSALIFLATTLFYALFGLAYDTTLGQLAHEGYMPPPKDLEVDP